MKKQVVVVVVVLLFEVHLKVRVKYENYLPLFCEKEVGWLC
jgi:hypothetical protein